MTSKSFMLAYTLYASPPIAGFFIEYEYTAMKNKWNRDFLTVRRMQACRNGKAP